MLSNISKTLPKIAYLNLSFFLLVLLGIFTLQQKQYQKSFQQHQTINYSQEVQANKVYLQSQQFFPNFGFNNLKSDSIYLQFLQYFGNKPAREQTGYTLVPQYFEAISREDPRFIEAHLNLSVANSMYAGEAEKTVNLMEKILQSNSPQLENNHLIWIAKGLDEFLFLGDNKAAENSHINAAQSAIQENTVNQEQIIQENIQKAQFLATNPDTTEAQITAWNSVLPNIVNPEVRQRILNHIQSLEKKQMKN